MKQNLCEFYKKILPHVRRYVFGRPLLILTENTHQQWQDRFYFKSHFISEIEDFDRFRIQAWNDTDWVDIIDKLKPMEFHVRMSHFFETHLREVVFDLDPSESIGLELPFEYGKGFVDWLNTNVSQEFHEVRMLFSGNRGFHIRLVLKNRKPKEALEDFMNICVDKYGKPFVGKVDTNMCNPLHFIRMPLSYHMKGEKLSFFVDKLEKFNEEIAKEKSQSLLEAFL